MSHLSIFQRFFKSTLLPLLECLHAPSTFAVWAQTSRWTVLSARKAGLL
jgi:hypothetical protein